MKYYISETPLHLREYGRNIQSMVEYLKTLEDKEVRTAVAEEVIKFMICLKPSIKENPDYRQQLWDYLFFIAEGELDVDAPFEFPDKTPVHHPVGERMPYPKRKPRLREFGVNIELMIERALEMEEGPMRDEYINMLANAVKMVSSPALLEKGTSPEDVIAHQIAKLSKNKLIVDASTIRLSKVMPTHPHQQPQRPLSKPKRGGKNNNRSSGNNGGSKSSSRTRGKRR